MKKIGIAGLLVGVSISVYAGPAAISVPDCASWNRRSDQSAYKEGHAEGWLVGFMSGLAANDKRNVLTGMKAGQLSDWVDNYCKANPLADVWEAGQMLYIEVGRRNGARR